MYHVTDVPHVIEEPVTPGGGGDSRDPANRGRGREGPLEGGQEIL